jgi:hypothetical protein
MTDVSSILSGVEGLAPEAIAAIENLIKAKEAELTASLETKYGVKPSVISDVQTVAADVAPAVEKAVEPTMQELLARLNSLEQQNAQLTQQIQNPEQVIASGGGDPVPHTLFLADGSVVKNHGGLATSYSTTNPDGSENIQKVIAAYPA